MGQTINKVYLHWSGTNYDWSEVGHYHACVDDLGHVQRLTDYHEHLGGHTFNRNRDAVALAAACMLNCDWAHYGPTEAQIDGLAKEAAKIAVGLKWQADEKFLEFRIMTHCEAAANRDFPKPLVDRFSRKSPSGDYDHAAQAAGLPHANYGIRDWFDGWPGGDVVRWDLSQLRPTDKPGTGGYELRERIIKWMEKILKAQG